MSVSYFFLCFAIKNRILKPKSGAIIRAISKDTVWFNPNTQAIFLQTGDVEDTVTRGWQLKKISLASVESDSVNTIKIDSLRIQSESHPNLVITNPLNTFFPLDTLLTFKPAELVTLTLWTDATNSEAFLHTFILIWPFYVRVKFNKAGPGVFTGTWRTQIVASPRFAFFDLLNRHTLYTPDAKYDFNGWLLPYKIKRP